MKNLLKSPTLIYVIALPLMTIAAVGFLFPDMSSILLFFAVTYAVLSIVMRILLIPILVVCIFIVLSITTFEVDKLTGILKDLRNSISLNNKPLLVFKVATNVTFWYIVSIYSMALGVTGFALLVAAWAVIAICLVVVNESLKKAIKFQEEHAESLKSINELVEEFNESYN